MPYKDISRGVQLAKDYENYKLWLEKDTEARQTAYAAVTNPANRVNIAREAGYIIPFDSGSTGGKIYLPARLIAAGAQTGRGGGLATNMREILDDYTITATKLDDLAKPPAVPPNVIEGVKKFKFASLKIIQRVTTATTKDASRITRRKYYRHETDSVTASFGKKEVADTYSLVIVAIRGKEKFQTVMSGNSKNRYAFTPEKGA